MLEAKWSIKSLARVTRVMGLAFVAMVGYGWWDESMARQGAAGMAPDDFLFQWAITTHFLPLLLIVLGMVFGWHKPFYGFLTFTLFAVLQGISAGTEFGYYPLVIGPPLILAILFLVGWLKAKSQ